MEMNRGIVTKLFYKNQKYNTKPTSAPDTLLFTFKLFLLKRILELRIQVNIYINYSNDVVPTVRIFLFFVKNKFFLGVYSNIQSMKGTDVFLFSGKTLSAF